MTVYWMPSTVSPPALRLGRKAEPTACSLHAWQTVPSAAGTPGSISRVLSRPKRSVPWLDGDSPTSRLILSAPPRYLIQYRPFIPPCECPTASRFLDTGG